MRSEYEYGRVHFGAYASTATDWMKGRADPVRPLFGYLHHVYEETCKNAGYPPSRTNHLENRSKQNSFARFVWI